MNLRLTRFSSLTILTVAVVSSSSSAVNGVTPNRAQFSAAWEITIGESESASTKRFCELLQVEREPVFAYDNAEIPVLVLNGGYDPVTPQRYARPLPAISRMPMSTPFPV